MTTRAFLLRCRHGRDPFRQKAKKESRRARKFKRQCARRNGRRRAQRLARYAARPERLTKDRALRALTPTAKRAKRTQRAKRKPKTLPKKRPRRNRRNKDRLLCKKGALTWSIRPFCILKHIERQARKNVRKRRDSHVKLHKNQAAFCSFLQNFKN